MLNAHAVNLVCDVRTVPKSRRNPQFNREALRESLASADIDYEHLPALGGLRHPRKDSINTAWQNESFRGYADYMQTPEFERGLHRLIELAERHRAGAAFTDSASSPGPSAPGSVVPRIHQERTTTIMCAEAVPWRCHRSLIADALTARGIPVEHLMTKTSRKPHVYTSFARVDHQRVTYPGVLEI